MCTIHMIWDVLVPVKQYGMNEKPLQRIVIYYISMGKQVATTTPFVSGHKYILTYG